MARTGDREIRFVSGGAAITGIVGIFILNELRDAEDVFPSSSHMDYAFPTI